MSTELGSGVKRMHVAELMRGVENVGGDTFVASRQEMAAHLANHQKAGATIREGGVNRITGRRWFEVNHGEGLKLRIFESAGESARPGMPGQAPPTEAQAAELRAAAKEAEAALKARDAKLTELVMAAGNPLVADTVIIGGGQAGTLAHVTVPARGRAVPGVEITQIPATFNVATEGSLFARHGDFLLGQGKAETGSPAMTRQPPEFSSESGGRAPSSDYVRALTMTAYDTGMATVRAKVVRVDQSARWLVAGRAVSPGHSRQRQANLRPHGRGSDGTGSAAEGQPPGRGCAGQGGQAGLRAGVAFPARRWRKDAGDRRRGGRYVGLRGCATRRRTFRALVGPRQPRSQRSTGDQGRARSAGAQTGADHGVPHGLQQPQPRRFREILEARSTSPRRRSSAQ